MYLLNVLFVLVAVNVWTTISALMITNYILLLIMLSLSYLVQHLKPSALRSWTVSKVILSFGTTYGVKQLGQRVVYYTELKTALN